MDVNFEITETTKFRISDIKLAQRIFVVGSTGSGKSWLVAYIMSKFAKKQLTVVLDKKDEYDIPELPNDFMTRQKGLYKLTSLEFDSGYTENNFFVLMEFLTNNLFKRGNACIVLEEVGSYIPKNGMLYETSPNVAHYLSQGRKRNNSLITTSQRPQQVHTDIPSQSEHKISFRVDSKHDLEAMKNYFSKEHYASLKEFQFLHKNTIKGTNERHYKLTTSQQYFGLKLLGDDSGKQTELSD